MRRVANCGKCVPVVSSRVPVSVDSRGWKRGENTGTRYFLALWTRPSPGPGRSWALGTNGWADCPMAMTDMTLYGLDDHVSWAMSC